ncbi:hydantoinase/oxoprolinase family protein [Methanocella arvoryzae]|uniref:hydantoinase/oxoprolinase family protein n=1 Tax=Methanocella arvoryzae TaxID=1175445 RepID=UPI001E393CFC|nr:hydantoinase/oxoprolinase family protein [Methanocella arvoryzae]
MGGANTKAASADGKYVETIYLPLWKGADLKGTLEQIRRNAGKDCGPVGITITGELADCYPSKRDGIAHISAVVKEVFPDARFYGYDGRFYETTENHTLFSAANWSASARYVGKVHGSVVFIDTGSTTTDIIPVREGEPAAMLTDFGRLGNNELIYAGTLRTNLAALLHTVIVRGKPVRTASELFAITGDVYLLLGRISPEDYACDTPDGGPKDVEGAARRIARVVCGDLEEIGMDDVREIAEQARRRQIDEIKAAVTAVSEQHDIRKAAICGLGSFIVKDALIEMGMTFSVVADERLSRVFPAYAVARLLAESEEE